MRFGLSVVLSQLLVGPRRWALFRLLSLRVVGVQMLGLAWPMESRILKTAKSSIKHGGSTWGFNEALIMG
jgi:hypothetical protein